MDRVKDYILRQCNDVGADTLEKYWAQIEYTAYWCVHLLLPKSKVVRVIPEGIEDVIIDKGDYYELHQVKCRDESQPPWTTAEILPILCDLYSKRHKFNKECEFHFVSDHLADSKTKQRSNSFGALQRLKHLLEILHTDGRFSIEEEEELSCLEEAIFPKIIENLLNSKDREEIDKNFAISLLHKTHIETNSRYVRNLPDFAEISEGFKTACPDLLTIDIPLLDKIYNRILILIVNKITKEVTFNNRAINNQDIMNCRYEPLNLANAHPTLDDLPGNTPLEKKAIFSGFSPTEIPLFSLQKAKALEKIRRFSLLGLEENIDDLSLALITKQNYYRREISTSNNDLCIGPEIYLKLQQDMPSLIKNYFPDENSIDEVFGLGLLWKATDECTLWWERLNSSV